ncbi:DUF594 family protein [Quillaja saponaria]|uniref:DUF594 family protein n=1 Tax=Quillaja saponaria TaxID=32244 RepID=A0AAD7L4M0_QUISA|nr:DUF594 family protein [Quillaja saponaria]KAJ7951471.1 DUF594 family protein [Quillaja saponaria]
MADSVATYALGILSNNLGNKTNDAGPLDSDSQLTAFWAPFLLLHLGGPDTITAFAFEDNELWLRHLFGLAVQTALALYIFLMSWTNSNRLAFLTIPMMFAGLIKYGERVWVLWLASNEQFRESIPDPIPTHSKIIEECDLKNAEGYNVMPDEVIEVQVPVDASAADVSLAYGLLQTFKRLFVDILLSSNDRMGSRSIFEDMSSERAFRVIEMELGFMYDILFTKAMATLYSKKYSEVDLSITIALLVGAISLEIYAAFVLAFSDWAFVWLSKHNFNTSSLQRLISSRRRWSQEMCQYSILTYCLKEESVSHIILKFLHIDEKIENYRFTTLVPVTNSVKELIFNHLKEKVKDYEGISIDDSDLRAIQSFRGGRVLEKYDQRDLEWSTKLEFDQSIIIWHLATELCYHRDDGFSSNPFYTLINENCRVSWSLSRYMMYLLVMYPSMLPTGLGRIRFRDTYAEAIKFFKQQMSTTSGKTNNFGSSGDHRSKKVTRQKGKRKNSSSIYIEASRMLLQVNTDFMPAEVKSDRSKFVLFHGCKLGSALNSIPLDLKWEIICNVWIEMVTYAAIQCRGDYHAQQLRRGGELLTHVWLLMAHFGLTEHFEMSQDPAIAKMNLQ